jgi:hypothetical protein
MIADLENHPQQRRQLARMPRWARCLDALTSPRTCLVAQQRSAEISRRLAVFHANAEAACGLTQECIALVYQEQGFWRALAPTKVKVVPCDFDWMDGHGDVLPHRR